MKSKSLGPNSRNAHTDKLLKRSMMGWVPSLHAGAGVTVSEKTPITDVEALVTTAFPLESIIQVISPTTWLKTKVLLAQEPFETHATLSQFQKYRKLYTSLFLYYFS